MIGTRRVHLVLMAIVGAVLLAVVAAPALAQGAEAAAGSVTLQVTPSSVPESGGEVELLAIVRDNWGGPLENAKVNFLTETGTLESGGRLVVAGTGGGAIDRLVLTASELAAVEENSFRIAVAVGSGGSHLVTSNVGVGIQRRPVAAFRYGPGDLIVAFDDESGGLVTSWSWSFGDGTTSTRQSPAHTFAEPGHYAVTLRVGNSVGTDEVTKLVRVYGSQGAGE